MALELTYIGHASFLMSADDVQWLTDPYDEKVGYPVMTLSPDVVTVSHGHHDHDYLDALQPGYTLINTTGEGEAKGLKWRCVESFHDDAQGQQRGVNRIYVVQIGGYTVAHLGDLGHELDQAALDALGKVDILLIPVGGFYTIDAQTAARVTEAVGAPVTIAMHFNFEHQLDMPIAGVEEYLNLTGGQQVPFSGMNFEGELQGRRVYAFYPQSKAEA